MLQLNLVSNHLFRSTMITSAFSTAAFLGLLFTMPLFLQTVRGVSALESGLTTFPEALGVLAGSQVAGRFYPTVGPRRLMAGGLLVMSVALTTLTTIDTDTSLWFIRVLMFVMGGSMSFIFIPNQAAALAQISSAETGHASAILNTQRQVASAFGVALLATVLAARLPDNSADVAGEVSAYHATFLTAAALALAGAIFALTIRDRDAHATMRKTVRQPGPSPARPGALERDEP